MQKTRVTTKAEGSWDEQPGNVFERLIDSLRGVKAVWLNLTFLEKGMHIAVWVVGLLLINIPSFETTVGLFHSNDGSLLLPSLYGTSLNIIVFYGNVFLVTRDFRKRPGEFLRASLLLISTICLIEFVMDSLYYFLFYQHLSMSLLWETFYGTWLMNGLFFYLPSFVFGSIKSLQVKETTIEKILIKDGRVEVFVLPEEILLVESDGNYAIFHLKDRKVMERVTLTKVFDRLPIQFIRCHKSFIVNKDHIDRKSYDKLVIGDFEVPVGRKYRAALSSQL